MSDLRDWEDRAREELNDIPELREARLNEFRRAMLKLETEDFKPSQDDELLMLFLRSRKFDLERALKTFKAWAVMRTVDPDVFFPLGKGPMDYRHVIDLPIFTVMPRVNHDRTTVIVTTYKHYNPSKFNFLDIFTLGSMLCAYLLRDPYIQTYGVRCVIDYRGLHTTCLKAIPYKYIKACISLLCPSLIFGSDRIFICI